MALAWQGAPAARVSRQTGAFLLSSSWKKHPTGTKPEHGELAVGERLIAVETEPYLGAESSCISASSPWWHRARPCPGMAAPLGATPGDIHCHPGGLAQGTGLLSAQLRHTHRHMGVTPPSTADTGFLVFSSKVRLDFLKTCVNSYPAVSLTANFAAGFLPLFITLCLLLPCISRAACGEPWNKLILVPVFLFAVPQGYSHIPHSWWLLHFPGSHSECCTYKPDTCHL